MCHSYKISNLTRLSNFSNNVARMMEFTSIDGGDDGKHNSIGFVEINKSKITFSTEADSFV